MNLKKQVIVINKQGIAGMLINKQSGKYIYDLLFTCLLSPKRDLS